MRKAEISAWRRTNDVKQLIKLRKFDDLIDEEIDFGQFKGLSVDQIRLSLWQSRMKYWTSELSKLNPDILLTEIKYEP